MKMKTFRLIVATRLALFPLIFNLSIAQELEVTLNNLSSWTEWNEVKDLMWEMNINTQDSSLHSEWRWDFEAIPQPSAAPLTWSEIFPLTGGVSQSDEGVDGNIFMNSSLHPEWQENIFLLDKGGGPLAVEDLQKFESDTSMDSSLRSEWQNNPNLIISEIYRLWTTERIEITNLSDKDFSWKLSLSWAKSSLYTKNLSIPSYSSIILADKTEIWLINDEILSVNNAWFNIVDSDEISVGLIYSWIEIDTFNVDKSTVSSNQIPTNKPRPTFQKFYNNWREIQITTIEEAFNITWNFIANPWKIIIKSWNPWVWNWPSGYPYNWDDSWNWDNAWAWDQAWTWNDSWIWGETWTWDITWEDSDFNLILSEVFYDDDDEWIEIFNIGDKDFLWDIKLSWAIFSDDKTNYTYQNIQIPAQDFLIIADSNEMFDFDWSVNILLNEWNYPHFSISSLSILSIFCLCIFIVMSLSTSSQSFLFQTRMKFRFLYFFHEKKLTHFTHMNIE